MTVRQDEQSEDPEETLRHEVSLQKGGYERQTFISVRLNFYEINFNAS